MWVCKDVLLLFPMCNLLSQSFAQASVNKKISLRVHLSIHKCVYLHTCTFAYCGSYQHKACPFRNNYINMFPEGTEATELSTPVLSTKSMQHISNVNTWMSHHYTFWCWVKNVNDWDLFKKCKHTNTPYTNTVQALKSIVRLLTRDKYSGLL